MFDRSRKTIVTFQTNLVFVKSYSSYRRPISSPHVTEPPRDIFSWNRTITNYFRLGDLKAARRLFDEMRDKNIITWNCMISGYAQATKLSDAQKLFDIMPKKNVVSWTALLTGYARNGFLGEAQRLFDEMPEKNIICWNSLINSYINNGKIEKARELFDKMPIRNHVSWAVMIGGYIHQRCLTEAHALFDQAPNKRTSLYNALLLGYVHMELIDDAQSVFDQIPHRDAASWTIMVTCYCWAGHMESARVMFEEMPEKYIEASTALIWGYMQAGDVITAETIFEKICHPDIIAYNSMIQGYIHNSMLESACRLFYKMSSRNNVSWNIILHGYVQEGDMTTALKYFDKMPFRDQISWNTIISGYQNLKAVSLFCRMIREGFKPDHLTFSLVIAVCASLVSLQHGRALHLAVIRSGYGSNVKVSSSLINMYSRCGSLSDACNVFMVIPNPDTVAWNAMVVAQAYNGSAQKARELLTSMVTFGLKPDHVTFLGLLCACAHNGLVVDGVHIFRSMTNEWKLHPREEHYSCMVDLFGRSGQLNEAYNLIEKMPLGTSTDVWEILLSECVFHGNLNMCERVVKMVLSTKPLDGRLCVLLSNMYAAKGMWEVVRKIRAYMKAHGATKEQACSWIEIKGKMYIFISAVRSLPEIEASCRELNSLMIDDIR